MHSFDISVFFFFSYSFLLRFIFILFLSGLDEKRKQNVRSYSRTVFFLKVEPAGR